MILDCHLVVCATEDDDFDALIARVVITLYETKMRFDEEMKGL